MAYKAMLARLPPVDFESTASAILPSGYQRVPECGRIERRMQQATRDPPLSENAVTTEK